MLDFEDVTPRKKSTENTEETVDTSAEGLKEPEMEEVVPETAEKDSSAESDHSEQEEVHEKEPAPQPGVREYHYEEQVKKPPKKKKGWAKFVVGCLIIGIAGGASIGAGYGVVDNLMSGRNVVTGTPEGIQKASSGEVYSATEIVKAVKPSVVSVSTKISGMTSYFGAFNVPFESKGAGSGVIFYSDDSRVAIATNNHVIENADTIYVTFEGDISVPAKVIGARSESDLAVLTVSWKDLNDAGIEQVTTAVFGDSDALEVGSEVIAIGNAMGMGLSATDGIISMKEQTINMEGNKLGVLQTSAAINSGNSGGALVNASGEVIGINTAKYNSAMVEGMGYAIPSNYIIPIVEELLQTGTQPKPYIGITGTNITEETAPMYKLPVGALVLEVTKGGPADKAGLQVGDVITQFNGQTVMDMDSLVESVNAAKIGSTVDMYVIRDGNDGVELKIKIEDKNS
ncbi:MAG: trypsin-like peptidase domain-containing protein [Anaerotignum sp.]|nr:trypsin-like peptidase domain-containing protein [Anaerotignum sp.]